MTTIDTFLKMFSLEKMANCTVGELIKSVKDINSNTLTISFTDDDDYDKIIAAFVVLRGDKRLKLLQEHNESN